VAFAVAHLDPGIQVDHLFDRRAGAQHIQWLGLVGWRVVEHGDRRRRDEIEGHGRRGKARKPTGKQHG
jgi:hypothetical protein